MEYKLGNTKKQIAILIGSTGNEAFAVGNLIIGLKKYLFGSLSEDQYDVIFYTDKISKCDESALKKIYSSVDIRVYNPPFLKHKNEIKDIYYYSIFTYVRFEAFNLLKNYKQILYLDTDLVIKNDISSLLECKDIFSITYYEKTNTLNKYYKEEIKKLVAHHNLNIPAFNAGVLLVSDKFPNYKEITKWLYDKSIEYKINDEVALNIFVQEFNITPNNLTTKYNGWYDVKNDCCILHSLGPNKFWRSRQNEIWNKNNEIWLSYGGSESYDDIEKKRKIISKIVWFIPVKKIRNKAKDILSDKFGVSSR